MESYPTMSLSPGGDNTKQNWPMSYLMEYYDAAKCTFLGQDKLRLISSFNNIFMCINVHFDLLNCGTSGFPHLMQSKLLQYFRLLFM